MSNYLKYSIIIIILYKLIRDVNAYINKCKWIFKI